MRIREGCLQRGPEQPELWLQWLGQQDPAPHSNIRMDYPRYTDTLLYSSH